MHFACQLDLIVVMNKLDLGIGGVESLTLTTEAFVNLDVRVPTKISISKLNPGIFRMHHRHVGLSQKGRGNSSCRLPVSCHETPMKYPTGKEIFGPESYLVWFALPVQTPAQTCTNSL